MSLAYERLLNGKNMIDWAVSVIAAALLVGFIVYCTKVLIWAFYAG
jgi:hypothetical protein